MTEFLLPYMSKYMSQASIAFPYPTFPTSHNISLNSEHSVAFSRPNSHNPFIHIHIPLKKQSNNNKKTFRVHLNKTTLHGSNFRVT